MYITNGLYYDLDFKNCHYVILNKLLKENNSKLTSTKYVTNPGFSSIEGYVKDRDNFLKNNKVNKNIMLKVLFNQENKFFFFKDQHNQIYKEFLPEIIKQNVNLYKRVKKDRDKANKSYNYDGAFLAIYIQNIENELLQILYKKMNEKGLTVGSLIFDGLLVEKKMY